MPPVPAQKTKQILDIHRQTASKSPDTMPDNESLIARGKRAAQIASEPDLYKVCEGCESIVVRDAATCPNCHGYRFDPDPARVVDQAEILGKRLPTSVPPSELQ